MLSPSSAITWQWCRKQSRIAVAVAASGRNWVQRSKSTLVVIVIERL